jgi:hypothetical protein
MTNRKEYLKKRFQEIKKQTKDYKLLLDQQIIELVNSHDHRTCISCGVDKILGQHFYLKTISLHDDKYKGSYETKCIECLLKKQKSKGKLFNTKISEKQSNLRECKKCKHIKEINADNFRLTQGKYLRRVCLDCDRQEANESTKKRLVYARDSIRSSQRKYQANRKKRDPIYRLRKYTSTSIYIFLRKMGTHKNASIMKYLPYTMEDLKDHLEKQFEPWMTWDNMGKYNSKTWDDKDQSTWKWNVDHIIPHSTFQYTSMEDQAFQECWALSNLRPYSAKQNIIDGFSGVRHGK